TPDVNMAGYDDVRCDKAVILDRRVVPDMVPAPQGNVVTNPYKRLNGVVFEDETVLAGPVIAQVGATRADITHQTVASRLYRGTSVGAILVHASIAQSDEHRMAVRRESETGLIEVEYRQTEKFIAAPECRIHCERHDFMIAIPGKVHASQPGDVASAENYD